jgi:NADPH:quinone reductase-like Zn-dependent oxidoreductase
VLLNQYFTGFFTRKTAKAVMVKPNAADMEWMKKYIEAGKLRVVVDKVFSLEQIKEALIYSESGKAKGKIVVRTGKSE